MSIYIKDMQIPENGSCIQIVIDDDGKVYSSLEKCIFKMDSIAKAIQVPPHGRLIDEKYIVPKNGYIIADGMACIPVKDIVNAPTVIPEEEDKQ